MVLWNKLSCLWTLGFCLVTSKRFSVPSIKDKSFIDQCVDAHNELRRQVQPPAANMKYMVIWANSYKVGCAINICPDLGGTETAIFICDYGPPGNYERTPPYTKGVPCSKCGKEDSCENKLCRNKERDTLIEYPNWNPHGKAAQQTACNLLCLVCVLLRLF
uniref:GLIPR1 like 1 n=1 Tax=Molossus molossus TaxID=27622 RepID=A0A7J8FXN1_MOLMO|nr:GLIPR1 like 1 [Molossus molossus]